MAIYYVKAQMVSRSKGRSIIAAAAYRSGKKMTDKETGKTHDYSRKTAVSFSEVFLPEGAPEEYKNSAVLWEAVQKNEKAKDAQLAREFVIALPEELTAKERQELVCDYARKLTEQGMCVDLSIHEKKGNPHAHLLCSTRPLINGKWTLKEKKEYALTPTVSVFLCSIKTDSKRPTRKVAGSGSALQYKAIRSMLEKNSKNGANYGRTWPMPNFLKKNP